MPDRSDLCIKRLGAEGLKQLSSCDVRAHDILCTKPVAAIGLLNQASQNITSPELDVTWVRKNRMLSSPSRLSIFRSCPMPRNDQTFPVHIAITNGC
jgi:hypothetical protein